MVQIFIVAVILTTSLTSGGEIKATPGHIQDASHRLYDRVMDEFRHRDYEAALAGFRFFLEIHGQSVLASNAQYWLGEISYNFGDYKKAAVAFGKGYKNYKSGNKGADSLYKLGVSMQQLGKNAEACAAYKSLPTEFPKADKELLAKSKKALTTLKCK